MPGAGVRRTRQDFAQARGQFDVACHSDLAGEHRGPGVLLSMEDGKERGLRGLKDAVGVCEAFLNVHAPVLDSEQPVPGIAEVEADRAGGATPWPRRRKVGAVERLEQFADSARGRGGCRFEGCN